MFTRTITIPVLIIASVMLTGCSQSAHQVETYAPGIPHYDIDLYFNPDSQEITAEGKIFIDPAEDAADEIEWFLHKQLSIDKLLVNGEPAYRIDTGKVELPFVPDSRRIYTDMPEQSDKEQVVIEFAYSGIVSEWTNYLANVITPEWTELGLYFPWYLFSQDYRKYTYEVRIQCPDDYKVFGLNPIQKTAEGWLSKTDKPVNDIVVFAAPEMKKEVVESGEMEVRIYHKNLSDSLIADFTKDIDQMFGTFTKWYGAIEGNRTIVQSLREVGGGYGRMDGIVLGDLNDADFYAYRNGYQRYFAHEFAHAWWYEADTHSWEDWINEALAEYSALVWMREFLGDEVYEKYRNSREKKGEGTRAIWGFDRTDISTPELSREVEAILYGKGPVFICELEDRIGFPAMKKFLVAFHKEPVKNTEVFLNLLASQQGDEVADWFERKLKTE